MSAVVLNGFQLMQLLGIVDHSATARIVIEQFDGYTHARALDSHAHVTIPATAAEAEAQAKAKLAAQLARSRHHVAVKES